MPKVGGREACAEMRRVRPGLPVILCSGYAADEPGTGSSGDGCTEFLHKPYGRSKLIASLRRALSGAGKEARVQAGSAPWSSPVSG